MCIIYIVGLIYKASPTNPKNEIWFAFAKYFMGFVVRVRSYSLFGFMVRFEPLWFASSQKIVPTGYYHPTGNSSPSPSTGAKTTAFLPLPSVLFWHWHHPTQEGSKNFRLRRAARRPDLVVCPIKALAPPVLGGSLLYTNLLVAS